MTGNPEQEWTKVVEGVRDDLLRQVMSIDEEIAELKRIQDKYSKDHEDQQSENR